jgi:pimeloyl-ACP methyl ester carboxylesterase
MALTWRRARVGVLVLVGVAGLVGATLVAEREIAAIAAGALLYPARHRVVRRAPDACVEETFAGLDVALAGWRCRAVGSPRATVVYLHGVADNRTSAVGWIERLAAHGFDVVAYDSRGHGESGGNACTYGYFEKQDLARVLGTLRPGPIVLIGTSLGGAVALQEAATDRRVTAIVAVETFADLRSVATERAPAILPPWLIRRAFATAERVGHFDVDAVSPRRAAAAIRVPVLLVHGQADVDTRPEHSRRVFEALAGPKELVLVPGAGHNHALSPATWPTIERWIDGATAPPLR